MCVAKTKALISCAVTVQLVCAFVFALAKIRFSHDAAHITNGKSLTTIMSDKWVNDTRIYTSSFLFNM